MIRLIARGSQSDVRVILAPARSGTRRAWLTPKRRPHSAALKSRDRARCCAFAVYATSPRWFSVAIADLGTGRSGTIRFSSNTSNPVNGPRLMMPTTTLLLCQCKNREQSCKPRLSEIANTPVCLEAWRRLPRFRKDCDGVPAQLTGTWERTARFLVPLVRGFTFRLNRFEVADGVLVRSPSRTVTPATSRNRRRAGFIAEVRQRTDAACPQIPA